MNNLFLEKKLKSLSFFFFKISCFNFCPLTYVTPVILAIRNLKKRTANSRSRAFAAVRERSPPFAVVRSGSQPFAAVRSGSPPFAVSLKLNIRYSFNKIRETKNIKSLFFIFKINNFELKKIVFKMKNLKKGNCLIS
jgi:hypothetical protein